MRITFTEQGWDDYLHWQMTDRQLVKKINSLVKDILRSPYEGLGKPEALKHDYAGWWSRRIDDEHRLVYRVVDDALQIAQRRFHYTRR